MREADQARKEGVEAKNSAESFIGTVEKQMTDMKEKISQADKEDLTKKIEDLRQALGADDIEKIKEGKKELEQASWKVSQAAYSSSGNASSDENQSNEGESTKKEEGKKEEEKK